MIFLKFLCSFLLIIVYSSLFLLHLSSSGWVLHLLYLHSVYQFFRAFWHLLLNQTSLFTEPSVTLFHILAVEFVCVYGLSYWNLLFLLFNILSFIKWIKCFALFYLFSRYSIALKSKYKITLAAYCSASVIQHSSLSEVLSHRTIEKWVLTLWCICSYLFKFFLLTTWIKISFSVTI